MGVSLGVCHYDGEDVFHPSITIATILSMRLLLLCITIILNLCYIKVIIISMNQTFILSDILL